MALASSVERLLKLELSLRIPNDEGTRFSEEDRLTRASKVFFALGCASLEKCEQIAIEDPCKQRILFIDSATGEITCTGAPGPVACLREEPMTPASRGVGIPQLRWSVYACDLESVPKIPWAGGGGYGRPSLAIGRLGSK